MKKIIGLFFLPIILNAQNNCNYSLSGKLTNNKNIPIKETVISLENLEGTKHFTGKTDSIGAYQIQNICVDTYELFISHPYYNSFHEFIFLDRNIKKNFILETQKVEYIEGIVALGKIKKNTNTLAENNISKDRINEYADTNLGTALSSISGVSTLSTGNNIVKPVIHGLHSSRVPVLNYEIRQEDQQWGVEHAPDIDLNVANSITLLKGAGALQYAGDAVGGLILVEPKKLLLKDTLSGNVLTSYISNGRGGHISSAIEKGFGKHIAIRLQGTYKRLGDLSAPNYNLSNTGIKENDFSIQTGYFNNNFGAELFYSYFGVETGILKAAHIGNLENMVNAINRRKPLIITPFSKNIEEPKQEVKHQLLKLKTYFNFNFGKLDFIYSYQLNNRKEFDIRRNQYKGKPSLDMDLTTHEIKLNFSHYSFYGLKGKAGVSYVFQENYPNVDTGVSPLVPYYKKNNIGLYFMEEYQIFPGFTIEGGFRYDYQKINALKFYKKTRWKSLGYDKTHSELIIKDLGLNYLTNPKLEYNGYAATFGGKYWVGLNHLLMINYSLSNRGPNPGELFSDGLHHSAAAVELGNLDLKNEKSNKLNITSQSSFFESKLTIELTAHYNFINNFINQIPIGAEYNIRGAFPIWEYKQTNAEIYGIDFSGNYSLNSYWNIVTDFSYLYGKDKSNSIALMSMPPANFRTSIKYTNKQWLGFFVKTDFSAVFRQTHYPDYNFNVQVVENGQIVNKLLDISTPPSSYQLVDFMTGFYLPITDKNKINISFSVKNIFNISYRNYLNRLRYYSEETGRNFILKAQYNF